MKTSGVGEYRIESRVASLLRERGVGIFGFADLSPIPEGERYGYPRSISFGYPIAKGILRGIAAGPTPEYHAEFNRLNSLLLATSSALEELILSSGYKALALEGSSRRYDAEALATMLPHKTSATLAGLGWIGKCAALVTEEFGPALRLSTVLTDCPLRTGAPVRESSCGACRACQDGCPASAIRGANWSRGMERDELYDAFACRSMAQKLSDSIGADHTICGICVANCPLTLRYIGG